MGNEQCGASCGLGEIDCGGWFSEPKEELVYVAVVHRHGARGPVESEVKALTCRSGAMVAGAAQWKGEELENVTPVGAKQLKAIGRWFNYHYLKSESPAFRFAQLEKPVKWRAGDAPRVRQSGSDFVAGFQEDLEFAVFPEQPEPYNEAAGHRADDVFRPWATNPTYLAAMRQRMTSDIWKAKASESAVVLGQIYQKLGLADEPLSLEDKLEHCTHIFALLECERFWPGRSEERRAVSKVLSSDEQKELEELAIWVWDQRFFKCGFGPELGGRLLEEIVEGMQTQDHRFGVYSGHDYTILSLLAALGRIDHYPKPALSYGAFLVFEVWKTNYGESLVSVFLNSSPFKDIESGDALDEFQDVRIQLLGDVPLQDLVEHVQGFFAAASPSSMAPPSSSAGPSGPANSSLVGTKAADATIPSVGVGTTAVGKTVSPS